MDEFEQIENECNKIKEANEILLTEFEAALKEAGLAESTMNNHIGNIDFYINKFLLTYEPTEAKEGVFTINSFLGDWFPRKAMWANPSSVKSNISSLKKFYTFMHSKGLIDSDDLDGLKEDIKENKEDWISNAKVGDSEF